MNYIHLLQPQVEVPVLLTLPSVDPYRFGVLIIFCLVVILVVDLCLLPLLLLLGNTGHLFFLGSVGFVARTYFFFLVPQELFPQLKFLHLSVLSNHVVRLLHLLSVLPFLLDHLVSLCQNISHQFHFFSHFRLLYRQVIDAILYFAHVLVNRLQTILGFFYFPEDYILKTLWTFCLHNRLLR